MTSWDDAHVKGGTFDPARMMSDLDAMGSGSMARRGRLPMRLVGQMGVGLLEIRPGIEQLVEYEATVNDMLNRGRTPTVCVYVTRRLSGAILMDLLRAHPLAVMNGRLHENPFYTPAAEMLRELRRRRASS